VFKAKGDWCEEHGFPESFCPICKPGAAVPDAGTAPAPAADWCVEHALPESKCTKCNPSLIADFKAKGDWCGEHGFPESVCPICNPQTPPAGAAKAAIEARVVRFRSKDIEQAAGIQTVAAEQSQATQGLDCPVHVVFDSDRVADVRAIVPGIVRTVRVELGAEVKQGAPLFHLESTRVGEVQGALEGARERVKSAEQNLARQRKLLESEVTSVRQVEVAEQELASAQTEARTAEATLRMAGAAQAAPSGRYTLTAPIAGTIVRRPAVVGVLATESESLATIADTSVMWAMCDLSETGSVPGAARPKGLGHDRRRRQPPHRRRDHLDRGGGGSAHTHRDRSRGVKNPEGRLRQNQFGRARIQASAAQTRVTVPRSAVQRVGEHEVVFVRTRPGLYEPRVGRAPWRH
jgi:cobalt-zinc-cadmium efflux system membrane fusion protein